MSREMDVCTVIGVYARYNVKKPHQKFLFFKVSVLSLGHTKPPIQRVPAVKRMEREADRSATSITEVKKEWNYLHI